MAADWRQCQARRRYSATPPAACFEPATRPSNTGKPEASRIKGRYGSFRKLGVPYFGGPYNKDPII